MGLKSLLYKILWPIMGYNNNSHISLLDNRMVYHACGAYAVSHIASLFFKKHYWILCVIIAILKEMADHFVFGCSSNEIKHLWDLMSWTVGGVSYYLIVLLKRKKYHYE